MVNISFIERLNEFTVSEKLELQAELPVQTSPGTTHLVAQQLNKEMLTKKQQFPIGSCLGDKGIHSFVKW